MSDLISREALLDFIEERSGNFGITVANKCNFKEIAKMVKAVDAVEVVHGYWIWDKDHWECSVCRGNRFHDLILGLDAEYCGRCGAKMDEGSE